MSAVALALMGVYLLVTLGIGVYGYRRTGGSPQEYFLAGGSLGRVVFPLTMFATLMSAFVFLGSAGFGYRHGLGWLALLGVEALAVVPLAVVGLRAFRLSRREGYITPTEMLGDLLDSDAVKLLVVGVQFAWAVPYVAIQAMGGGLIFRTISGGTVSFTAGAAIVTVVTAVYLGMGGLRSVAWSDVLQGVTVVVLLVAAFVFVVPAVEPLALTRRIATETDRLTQAGQVGFFTPRVWLSFLLMNTMAVVAYPQLFQRFFAATDERSFRALLAWWPVMVLIAAVVPVLLGVWGGTVLPDLGTPDQVVPAILQAYAPPIVVGVVMGGALAAMMSTADSLVLTLSSLVTRDVYHDHLAGPDADERRELWVSRGTAAVLLAGGFVLAHAATGRLPGIAAVGTIVDLSVYFIQGNALLLPVFVAALYWRQATATGAIAAVIVGQGYFLGATFAGLPTFRFLPFVPALVVTVLALGVGSLATDRTRTPHSEPEA
ncbi:sodium:solute symporter family protein [Haloarcula halophila]|uniref:sodium:solute symporter family protein n=1 Tax=Haloarcula TaxID=2237 RepID=UPI0023E42581|nr:sodium:solute symporter family protein [Halomicroarcula sp. DFY41]